MPEARRIAERALCSGAEVSVTRLSGRRPTPSADSAPPPRIPQNNNSAKRQRRTRLSVSSSPPAGEEVG